MSISQNNPEDILAQKKPVYVNARAQIEIDGTLYSLFLDINKKQKIREAGYQIKGDEKLALEFSNLIKKILNKNITQLKEIDSTHSVQKEFVNIPLLLLRLSLRNFYGDEKSFRELTNVDEQKLLCRCYGVDGHRVENLIMADSTMTLAKVMQDTQATTGCGTCSSLIKDYIQLTKDYYQLVPGRSVGDGGHRFDVLGKRVSPGGQSPFQLLLTVDEFLKRFGEKIIIKELNGYQLVFDSASDIEGMSVDFIQKALYEEFKIRFQITFS